MTRETEPPSGRLEIESLCCESIGATPPKEATLWTRFCRFALLPVRALRLACRHVTNDAIFVAILRTPENRLALVTTTLLVIGTSAYYFLRLHLPLAIPALEDEGVLTRAAWGQIISVAYFVNILGKTIGGALVDLTGQPKWLFVLALLGCGACAVAMTYWHTFAALMILWCITRLMTSGGRLGSIKIVLAFWPRETIGTVIGLVNLSCSVGDVLARFVIGKALDVMPWQSMMLLCTGIATLLIVPTALLVSSSPEAAYESELLAQTTPLLPSPSAMTSPSDMPVQKRAKGRLAAIRNHWRPASRAASTERLSTTSRQTSSAAANYWRDCLRPLLVQPKFYILLLLSTSLQLMTEIPGQLTHLYLRAELATSVGAAGSYSSYIRMAGTLSPFLGGYLVDKVRPVRRGLLTAVFTGVASFGMLALVALTNAGALPEALQEHRLGLVMITFGIIEFFVGPPNSFLDGVFLLDLNGVQGAATAAGIVGSCGYLLPALVMAPLMRLTSGGHRGWMFVWATACLVGLVSTTLCLIYWAFDERQARNTRPNRFADNTAGSPDGPEASPETVPGAGRNPGPAARAGRSVTAAA